MAAPLAVGEGATEILSEGLISQPYVEMTVELMRRFSIQVSLLQLQANIFRHGTQN